MDIKFLAWDKELKRFSTDALQYRICDINYLTDYIWLQYTGYKDSTGAEIYEGHIIKTTNGSVVVIKRRNHQFVPCQKYTPYGGCDIDDFGKIFSWQYAIKGKIIGNIYENPDLLKPQN